MITKLDINKSFKDLGLTSGDILILQSSYKGCGGIENGPDGLIDVLMELLGTEGTLIMPAYNFTQWTEKHYFDILETPSEVGLITEIFRKRPEVGRTTHPIHSLSVWGKHKEEFEKLDYTNSFGEDSIFAKLIDKNALYVTIGLGHKMPFLPCHYSEVQVKVPYRRIKDFAGIYIDKKRNANLKVYNFHVRVNQKNPVHEAHSYLIDNNFVKSYSKNDVLFCYSRAKDYHSNFIDFIKNNPKLFAI
jgi:aminoglycoside 3-N-acetyltransferase